MAVAETKKVVTGVATATAAETTIATSDTVSWNASGVAEGLIVRGVLNMTAGAGTTAVVVKVRRGTGTGGATVGPAAGTSHTLAAAASANLAFEVLDTAPLPNIVSPSGAQDVPQNLYTVTVAQTGGTGAGTVNYGTIGIETAASTG
jgi:hypothetical protein